MRMCYIFNGGALWGAAINRILIGNKSVTCAHKYIYLQYLLDTTSSFFQQQKKKPNDVHAVSACEYALYCMLELFMFVYVMFTMTYTAYYCLLCLLFDDICNIDIFHHFT